MMVSIITQVTQTIQFYCKVEFIGKLFFKYVEEILDKHLSNFLCPSRMFSN